MTKHGLIGVITFAGVALVGYIALTFFFGSDEQPLENVARDTATRCLSDNEYVEYEIENNQRYSRESFVHVEVRNSETAGSVATFTAPILQPGHYHPVELRNCGVYFLGSSDFLMGIHLTRHIQIG